MAALEYVDVPGYAALILRRTFPELEGADGLISRAHEWLQTTDAAWNEQKKRWTFPSGATLQFGHVKDENDKYRYQGQAFQFVGFDELTHFSETQYEYIGFSRARRRKALDEIGVPIRTRATGNPGGVGHGWVKRRFITTRKPGVVFIPARVTDNPGLDVTDYAASLSHLPDELRRQLLEGDWDAFEGAAYPMFDEAVHVVDSFEPPNEWQRFEQMDFGVSNPTAWHLNTTDYDGNQLVADEYYSPGYIHEHAEAILARRAGGWEAKDDEGWTVRNRCFADPSIRNRTGAVTKLGEPASVLTEFTELGIGLTPANNDPRAGFNRVAELLSSDPERAFPAWHPRYGQKGAPRLFISRNCPELIEQLKTALLKPEGKDMGEIVDPDWESAHGHAHAALRYGVMSRPGPSSEPEPEPDDPRLALIQRRAERHRKRARTPHDLFREL